MSRRDPKDDPDSIKKENRALKRQLARANREIARLQGTVEEKTEESPEPEASKLSCPKCGSTDLGEISTPNGKKIVSCRACKKWRSKAS